MVCCVMSCRAVPYHVMSCRVVPCHVMLCRVVSCHVMSCHVVSCRVMSCRVVSCRIMPCRAVLCHVIFTDIWHLYFVFRLFPESPRWLVAQGRLDEAHAILMKFGSKTKQPVDQQELRMLLEDVRNEQLEQQNLRKTYHVTDLCKTPRIRRFSLLACFNW